MAGPVACTDPRVADDGGLTISKETRASWVRNFNPLIAPSISRWPTTCGIYEPLLVFNVMTETYVPWLATDYAWSDDNLRLSLTLREEVQWSDGATFDAEDVVFTFELLKTHPALDLKAVWTFVESVSSPDPLHVVFEFSRPFVPGFAYLVHQPIVPEHDWREVTDPVTYANENPIATGPFTEVRVFREQLFVLGANPRYWQPGKPYVDALRFPAYSGNDQTSLALINDEVDWGGNFVPAIDRIFVGKDPAHHHYWFPLVGNMAMLYANNTHPDLSDARLRKALSRGIDRALLSEVAMYGHTRPADATALSDAYASWRKEEIARSDDWTGYDPDRAARTLDELGYRRPSPFGPRTRPDGTPLELELNVITGWSDWVRAAQIVSRELTELGVDVRVKTYDLSAWFDRMQRGDFDLAIGWTVKGPTPYVYYRGLMSSHQWKPLGEASQLNWHRFRDDAVDALFDAFEATRDRDEQGRIADALQRQFVAHAPSIPLFPNPPWGTFNTARFEGFPDEEHPYANLTPNDYTQPLLVLTEVRPRSP